MNSQGLKTLSDLVNMAHFIALNTSSFQNSKCPCPVCRDPHIPAFLERLGTLATQAEQVLQDYKQAIRTDEE